MRAPVALLILLAGVPSSPTDLRDTGERFRTPILGREHRVLVDGKGALSFVDAEGRSFASAEAAVRAEEAGLPVERRVVHRSLHALLDDPSRALEPVRVVLVTRRQPVRDAALAVRGRLRPLLDARLARLRAIAAGIERAPDPDGVLQLGHRLEEEARLLSPEARIEAREIREEFRLLVRGMRKEILDAARPGAAALRAPVLEGVRAIPGARVLAESLVLCAVTAEVPAGSLAGLARDLPSVARILPHGVRRAGLDTSVATLGASTWASAGYDGSSTTKVCVMDTGIDPNHPALSSILGAQKVFLDVGKQQSDYAEPATPVVDDIHGHGTHVGGIVMSQDSSFKGVAPGGVLMNGKCGYLTSGGGGNLQDGDIMSAGDWAADNGADAVNASFGGGGTSDASSALSLWFEALVAGPSVFAAVAAGNDGPGSGTVGIPGDAYNVVTVGSLNDNGSSTHTDNSISGFSSRGPLDDGRRKPEVCAPGSNISSCSAGWEGGNPDFVSFNGTSMATPHVAGAAAILLDYAASWSPAALKALLASTTRRGTPYPNAPDNTWGWGPVDLAAAFASRATVKEGSLSATGPAVAFFQLSNLASGKRATLCWDRDISWADSSAPTSGREIANLDLAAYDESNQASLGTSSSALLNTEQVTASATATFGLLKVKRNGDLPAGQSTVEYALATDTTGALIAATPPTLSCSIVLGKANARPGDVFTVDVTLSDTGDLIAFSPSVTLTLPAGYALESGSLTQGLQAIAAGASRTATWSVVAGGAVSGTATFSATGSCNSYGETFTSAAASLAQPFDAFGPTGIVAVQNGAAAVSATGVTVTVFANDDATGVSEMRARNDGGAWDPWQAYAPSFPWSLPTAEGSHSVEVQLRDAAGNLSGVLSDSIYLDKTAPTGSFLLADGDPYVMPFETLFADATTGDGIGSGVSGFRVRWGTVSPWSEWLPASGDGSIALARPPEEGDVRAEGQFRDAAGNVSTSSFDGVHLVPVDPPSLSAVKSYAGRMAAGGDVDPFVLGALPGDEITVKIRSAPAVKGGDFEVEADLFAPNGAQFAYGRYPEGGAKPGISRYLVTSPGRHWIVLRAAGADAAAGGTYALAVKVATAKANRSVYLPGDPVDGEAAFPFAGAEGSVLVGAVRGPVTGPILLEGPDGNLSPVATVPLPSGGVKVVGLALADSGNFVLRVPASGPLLVDLKVRPPKRVKAVEPVN